MTRQREDCRALCEAKGWPWVEYVDNDTSASARKPRPAYRQLLADISNGAIHAVVVWDLDRLHRQPRELEEFIDLADAKSVALATITGDTDLSTDNGRLYARIKGAVARAETERKVARMKRRYRQDVENGRPHGPARAFGYAPDHHLDPDEAPAVRQAYSDVLAGTSLRSIAAAWNTAGFTSARGKAWTQTGVRAVLLNPRNAGLSSHRGQIVTVDGKAVEGNWPAIVDRDVFDAVANLLTDPSRRRGSSLGRKYLLSGLAVCGKCGHTMSSAMPSKRGQQPRYHCRNCLGVSRKIESVDEYVLSVVAHRLARPDARGLLEPPNRPDLAVLRNKANTLRHRQEEMAKAFADGAVTMAQLRTSTAAIETELAKLDAVLTDSYKSRVFDGVIGADPAVVRARIDALDLDRKRKVIDAAGPSPCARCNRPGHSRQDDGPIREQIMPKLGYAHRGVSSVSERGCTVLGA